MGYNYDNTVIKPYDLLDEIEKIFKENNSYKKMSSSIITNSNGETMNLECWLVDVAGYPSIPQDRDKAIINYEYIVVNNEKIMFNVCFRNAQQYYGITQKLLDEIPFRRKQIIDNTKYYIDPVSLCFLDNWDTYFLCNTNDEKMRKTILAEKFNSFAENYIDIIANKIYKTVKNFNVEDSIIETRLPSNNNINVEKKTIFPI